MEVGYNQDADDVRDELCVAVWAVGHMAVFTMPNIDSRWQ